MKTRLFISIMLIAPFISSCENDDGNTLGGSQSPMGEVGATVSSTSITVAGVSGIEAEVTTLEGGVSVFTGSAVVTNTTIRNILSNHPGTEVDGNNVTVDDIKVKITTDGIESVTGLSQGIIVKFDAKVGDTYTTDDGIRTVVSRSTDDDYSYGFWLIKVIEVEEDLNKFGVKKIVYWANHKFGLVGIEFTFDDNSTARYPVYSSAENK